MRLAVLVACLLSCQKFSGEDGASLEGGVADAVPEPVGPRKLVFVSTRTFVPGGGDFYAAATEACNEEAAKADLSPSRNFVAWLSNNKVDAIDSLSRDGAWALARGPIVFPTRTAILSGPLAHAIDQTVDGTKVAPGGNTWTGTGRNGRHTGASCDNWANGLPTVRGTVGDPTAQTDGWTAAEASRCDRSLPVVCFEE